MGLLGGPFKITQQVSSGPLDVLMYVLAKVLQDKKGNVLLVHIFVSCFEMNHSRWRISAITPCYYLLLSIQNYNTLQHIVCELHRTP